MILASHGIIGSQIVQFTGVLLDDYPNAAAAYSLRKLRSAYTGSAIRVRRASDNTEQDIGFVNNELDTATLTSFCSGTNGFVKTWYDQSGNGNDATQTTAANQPQIVSSGSVVLENGKPTISNNTALTGRLINATLSIGTTQSNFVVAKSQINNRQTCYDSFNNVGNGFARATNENLMNIQGIDATSSTDNSQHLFAIITNTNKGQLYEDSVNTINSSTNPYNGLSGLSLFQIRGNPDPLLTTYQWEGTIQEIIFYPSDQSSNRTGISTNINNFYSIY